MIKNKLVHIMTLVASFSSLAQSPTPPLPTIPGVPEPGILVWGSVTGSAGQPVTISSVSAKITETPAPPPAGAQPPSAPEPKIVTIDAKSKPAARIISHGGRSYYAIQFPFDSRKIGTAQLGDPASQELPAAERRESGSFALQGGPLAPSYQCVTTINGTTTTVKAVDGNPTSSVPDLKPDGKGKVVRIDLTLSNP